MNRLHIVISGALLGLIMPTVTLAFLWSGLGYRISICDFDATDYLWPTNGMLLIGWRTTPMGIITTVAAVLINCVLYATVGLLLHTLILLLTRVISRHRDSGVLL